MSMVLIESPSTRLIVTDDCISSTDDVDDDDNAEVNTDAADDDADADNDADVDDNFRRWRRVNR